MHGDDPHLLAGPPPHPPWVIIGRHLEVHDPPGHGRLLWYRPRCRLDHRIASVLVTARQGGGLNRSCRSDDRFPLVPRAVVAMFVCARRNQGWVSTGPEVMAVGECHRIGTLGLTDKAASEASCKSLLMGWRWRVDNVGRLPKRPGYPLPCP